MPGVGILCLFRAIRVMRAVKIIEKAWVEDMEDLQREVELMQMIDHPHVLQLYETFDESRRLNLVLELATGSVVASGGSSQP